LSTQGFAIDDLMDILVSKAGLPRSGRTADPQQRFADVGLDSLAFLQLQTELSDRYGFEMPDDRAQEYTFGEIVAFVNARLDGQAVA
jgi:acyl carrier protein